MNANIKIAHVVCTYPPYRGGMGRVAFEYTERLRDRGYNVHVFTTKTKTVADDPDYVHRIPSLVHVGNAGVMPSLFKRLKGFDLIHLHYPFFGGAEPVIVRKAMKDHQGLVMTYHMDAVASGIKGAIFGMHRRVMFPWLLGRVDRILGSSKDYIETSAVADVEGASERMEIHPFGIDLERFKPGDESEFKQSLGIRANVPILLFVGGLDRAHHFKGVTEMLEALKEIQNKSWHLVIVGSGDLKQSFEATVEQWGMSSRVTFAGDVSNENLPRYYRTADIHLFPSTRRAEAFGLVALEAAASGTPSIASNLPGVRTVVLDSTTGLLVPPQNVEELSKSIEFLLEDGGLRERLGQSARAHAEANFAWEPLIAKLEQTYKSVIDQQATRQYAKHEL